MSDLRRLGAMVLVALIVGGCMGGPMGPMGQPMHGPARGNDTGAPSPRSGAVELVVVALDFSFAPAELRLAIGETVNLTLDNRGRLFHDLTIDELDFVLPAEAGSRSSGALTVLRAGRYRIVCSVPGHAEAGMSGVLVVG